MPPAADQFRPRPIAAFLAGLPCPGAGLCYAGRPIAGLVVATLFALSSLVVPLVVLGADIDVIRFPGILRATVVALWVPSAVFGVVAAAVAGPSPQKAWQHPWWILGIVVLAWSVHVGLRERVVRPHLVTVGVPTEDQLRPIAPPDARLDGVYVVVSRRFAPADVRPGAWVLLSEEGRVARVTSTTSGIELDDGTRASPATILGVGGLAR